MFHSKLFVYWRVVNKVIIIMVTNRCPHKRRSNTKMPWDWGGIIMLVKNLNFTGVHGRIEVHLYFMGAIHQLTSGGTHFIYVNIETPLKRVLSCVTYMFDSWNLWASHLPQSVYGHLKKLAQKLPINPVPMACSPTKPSAAVPVVSWLPSVLHQIGFQLVSARILRPKPGRPPFSCHSYCWISSQKKRLWYILHVGKTARVLQNCKLPFPYRKCLWKFGYFPARRSLPWSILEGVFLGPRGFAVLLLFPFPLPFASENHGWRGIQILNKYMGP